MPIVSGTESSRNTNRTWPSLSGRTALASPATASGTAEKASHLICSRSMPIDRRNRTTSDQHAPPITGNINATPMAASGVTSDDGRGVNGLLAYAASCSGPGLSAMKAAVVTTARPASQPSDRQRDERRRPSGNRSNRGGGVPALKRAQVQKPRHPPDKPPGSEGGGPRIPQTPASSPNA